MSGNWLYIGVYTEAGNICRSAAALPTQRSRGMFHQWAFNWPANRRVMYNRASADAAGKPWDPKRAGHQVERREVGRRRSRLQARLTA